MKENPLEKLLPCPFCGANVRLVKMSRFKYTIIHDCVVQITIPNGEKKEIIRMWNNRF